LLLDFLSNKKILIQSDLIHRPKIGDEDHMPYSEFHLLVGQQAFLRFGTGFILDG